VYVVALYKFCYGNNIRNCMFSSRKNRKKTVESKVVCTSSPSAATYRLVRSFHVSSQCHSELLCRM